MHKSFETALPSDTIQLSALADRRELEELGELGEQDFHVSQYFAKMQLLSPDYCYSRELLIKVWKKWDEVAPGYKCPINFTPAQYEEHAEANAYRSEHLGDEHSLRVEFSLGDFGIVSVNPLAMDGTPDPIFPHTSHISCSKHSRVITSSSIAVVIVFRPPSCAMCMTRKCQHLTPLLNCYHLHLVPRLSTDDDIYVSSKGLAAERGFPRVIVATNNSNIVGVRLITNLSPISP